MLSIIYHPQPILNRGLGALATRLNIFTDRLSKPGNRLHCVSWDHDMWSSIDCETSLDDQGSSPLVANQRVSVNCTCLASSRVYAVIEETISDGHEYLDNQTDSVIFSICSSVSLAVMLLTTVCLTCLNTSGKTSVSIHRNVALNALVIHVFVFVVVLANTRMTSDLR